jgi:mono/diheme cytochrome c family protein/plastocyanin
MKRSEFLARVLIVAGVLVALAAPLWFWKSTSLIHARMADNGGWSPDVLQARVGQPLHLRLTSDDVTHGFAVGQMDMQSVDIEPGKVKDVTLTFDKPGTYTFYCTRWCGINHWRMRGTIEVSGPASGLPAPISKPLYVTLGLDIDAAHPAAVTPAARPSANRGALTAALLPKNFLAQKYASAAYYRSHSPAQAFGNLRSDPTLTPLDDAEIWDLVAYIWQSNTSAEDLAAGRVLFTQNCAACHGESGSGNGVFADALSAAGQASAQTMSGASAMTMQRPADFTDPKRMLGASPALLEGKILRGGMGTGMPTWGVIFQEDDIWKIISYLYTLQFQEVMQ